MQQRPTQSDFYQLGAGAVLIGGFLAIIFNLLHPRHSEALSNTRAELKMIAESDIWTLVHIMLGIAVAIIAVGVIAIALSMFGTQGDAWARAWLIFSAASTAVLMVLLALDGTAIKSLADDWAKAGNDPAVFSAAKALVEINGGLLRVSILVQFGISPLLFGMAVWASGSYPKAIAQASLSAGAVGVIAALWISAAGYSTVPLNILFPIASLLYTIVLMWAGWQLWQTHATLGPSGGTTTVTRTETTITPGL